MRAYVYSFFCFGFSWLLFNLPCSGDFPEHKYIDAHAAYELIPLKSVVFLDVSPYGEYEIKHASGAESFSFLRLPEFEQTYPLQKLTYILIGERRDSVYNYLYHHNYKNIFTVGRSEGRNNPFNNTEEDWESKGLPVKECNLIETNSGTFKASQYSLLQKKDTSWITVAHFPLPTIPLFTTYRPSFGKALVEEDSLYDLFSDIWDLSYQISCITFYEGKIWAGFSFYAGEGCEGYGGIGFYDLATKKIGILRHPAFVDCSVRSLSITIDKIYVSTINNFERGYVICNGLVEIDKHTLQTTSRIPPKADKILDEEDSYLQQSMFYEKSISSILRDKRFITQSVPQLEGLEKLTSGSAGLEALMLATVDSEVESRTNSILHSHQCFDTLLNIRHSNVEHSFTFNTNPEIYYTFNITSIPNKNSEGGQYFSRVEISIGGISENGKRFAFLSSSESDSTIEYSDSKYLFLFVLNAKNIELQNNTPMFTYAQIRVIIKEIR